MRLVSHFLIFVAKTRKRNNKLPKIRPYTVGNMYLWLLMFIQDRQNHEKNYLKKFFSDLTTLIFSWHVTGTTGIFLGLIVHSIAFEWLTVLQQE